MGRVIREQMRAVGARLTLAPVLDVARDPRWGRSEETYGESAYLTSRMGVGYVRGVQGESLAEGVAATGKHFLGYGLPEGGLNHAPAHLGPRELREVFAAPFGAAIREAGLACVMNSYGEVDGLPCGGAREILEDLLRGELGFEGLVVADYFTTGLLVTHHRVAADKGEAAQRALEAGLDAELPALDCYGAPLRERIERGLVPIALVDRSVERVLRLKLELGLFEAPFVDEAAAPRVYQTAETRALAREIAGEVDRAAAQRGRAAAALPGPAPDRRRSARRPTTCACSRATTAIPPTRRSSMRGGARRRASCRARSRRPSRRARTSRRWCRSSRGSAPRCRPRRRSPSRRAARSSARTAAASRRRPRRCAAPTSPSSRWAASRGCSRTARAASSATRRGSGSPARSRPSSRWWSRPARRPSSCS